MSTAAANHAPKSDSENHAIRIRRMGASLAILGPLGFILFAMYAFWGDGEIITAEAFLSDVLPRAGVPMLLLAAVAYGYWSERPWSRHLVMVFWLLVCVLLIAPAFTREVGFLLSSLLLTSLLLFGLSAWYLYENELVVAYYKRLGGGDFSHILNSRYLMVLLVVPFLNLLVLIKIATWMLDALSARLQAFTGSPGVNPTAVTLYSVGYALLIGLVIVYLVGMSFSYLGAMIVLSPEMSLGGKLYHLVVWPYYHHLVIAPE